MIWTIIPLVILINTMYLVLNWKRIKRFKEIEKQPYKNINDNICIIIGYIKANWGTTWQWSLLLIFLVNILITVIITGLSYFILMLIT